MESHAEDVRGTSADLEFHALLRRPTSDLLGVSSAAAAALASVGIDTIFDLAASHLFRAAASALELGRVDDSAARFGLTPGDLLGDQVQLASPGEVARLPLSALRMLSAEQAAALTAGLDIGTIRDLAHWPPYRAARRLLGDSLGSTQGPEDQEAEELRPRFGEYPTERVYYTTMVMLQMDGQTAQTDLTGPVSLDPAVQNAGGFTRPAIGALLTFSQSWYAQGVTLGQMLHSLALAPGEATRIAVIDWSRRTRSTASETVTEAEQLDNTTQHSRALSEVQSAVANDFQAGGSRSSSSSFSQSGSIAAAAGTGLLTSLFASGDVSTTFQEASTTASAESSSWSIGNRSVLGTMTQNVNDRTEQHATSVRNRRASAVREVSQSEHEQISTRIVANYNHMHALTVQYYEVVQVYRVQSELQRADRLLFVPMQLLDFSAPGGMRIVERFRGALARAALNRRTRSLLLDDTTTVAIQPVAPVRVAAFRPEIHPAMRHAALRVDPALLAASPAATILAELAPRAATPAAPEPPPGRATFAAARTLRIWDERAIARVSHMIDRPIIRPDSDALHVPDDADLLAISFDQIDVRNVRLDAVGADPALDQPLSVPSDDARVDLPRPIRLAELDAIAVAKSEDAARTGSMTLHCSYLGRRFSLPALPIELATGTTLQQVVRFATDRADRQRELLALLQDEREYYSRAVFRALDSATLTMVLSGFRWNGRPLIDQVEPNPLTVAGNFLVLRAPVAGEEPAGVGSDADGLSWNRLLESRGLAFGARDQRLVPIPTAGVFAEAVLGRSNCGEKLDITRFWQWQDSPIPLSPPDIPVQTGSRATADELKPGQLSAPVLNIVNPTSLPEPAGLGAAMNALTNLNFRDMSGLAGTQGLVQAGMAGTLKAATDAGQLASENMKTEAQKAVAMGQIAADLAKSILSAATGVPMGGGGGSVQGISGDGARINHGRDMDARGVPVPGEREGAASGGSTSTRPGTNGSGAAGSNGSGAGRANGSQPDAGGGSQEAAPRRTNPAPRRRSHEARAADPAIRAEELVEDTVLELEEEVITPRTFTAFAVQLEPTLLEGAATTVTGSAGASGSVGAELGAGGAGLSGSRGTELGAGVELQQLQSRFVLTGRIAGARRIGNTDQFELLSEFVKIVMEFDQVQSSGIEFSHDLDIPAETRLLEMDEAVSLPDLQGQRVTVNVSEDVVRTSVELRFQSRGHSAATEWAWTTGSLMGSLRGFGRITEVRFPH